MTEVIWRDVPALARALPTEAAEQTQAPDITLYVKVPTTGGREKRVTFRAEQLVFLAAREDGHGPCLVTGQPISGRFAAAVERPRAGRLGPLSLTAAFAALGEDAARDVARTAGRLLGTFLSRTERAAADQRFEEEHLALLAEAGSFPAYLERSGLRWMVPVALGEEEKFVTVPPRLLNAVAARLERAAPLSRTDHLALCALHEERERSLDAGVRLGVPEYPAMPPVRPKPRVSPAVERARKEAEERAAREQQEKEIQAVDEALEKALNHARRHNQPLAPGDWLAYLLRNGVVYSDSEYAQVRAWLPLARRRALDRKLRRRFPLTNDELQDVQDAARRMSEGQTPPSAEPRPRRAPLAELAALRAFAELLASDLARHGYALESDALYTHRGGPLRLRWVQERFGGFARRLERSEYQTLPEDVLTEAVSVIRQDLPVHSLTPSEHQ